MLIALFIFIGGLALDQVSKILVRAFITEGRYINILGSFLSFTHSQNTGIAFGLGADTPWFIAIVLVITVAVLAVLGYFFTKVDFKTKKIFSISIPLMIAGTMGNGLDRIIFSSVTDFITHDVPVLDLFQIYNFADAMLIIGLILLVVDVLFFQDKRKKKLEETRQLKQLPSDLDETN